MTIFQHPVIQRFVIKDNSTCPENHSFKIPLSCFPERKNIFCTDSVMVPHWSVVSCAVLIINAYKMSKMLEYENQMFLEILQEDGLVITAK